jgi:hypothetical protein
MALPVLGNVVAMRDRDPNTPSDQGVPPWALVVSNHRPPPCKSEEDDASTSDDPEKPSSDDENE